MSGLHEQELFDRYAKGQLDEETKRAFEKQLAEDPALRASFEDFKEVILQLKKNKRRNALKKELETTHVEMLKAKSHKRGKKLGRTIRFHSVTMLVAATVALIIVFGSVLTVNYINSAKTQEDNYIRLKREVAQIQRSQRAIIDTFRSQAPVVERRGKYTGTGFLLNSKGYVLTCHHLVKNQDSIALENEKFGKLTAYLVKYDPKVDLALLQIKDSAFRADKNFTFTFSERESLLGEEVFTLGFPKNDVVYNEGSVSSHSGYLGDTTSYQVSIPLNPGNSGGPLINDLGCVVGIVNGKNPTEEGAAFAMKSFYLKRFFEDPADSANHVKVAWGKYSGVSNLGRSYQVKNLIDYVFEVKVYEN